jgi:hypothetical protein
MKEEEEKVKMKERAADLYCVYGGSKESREFSVMIV